MIVGAMAIEGNVYDGHPLKPQLLQVRELTGGIIKKAIVDRGYRIKENIGSIEIVMPKVLKEESYYMKKQREARCRSRAGIEGMISHLKYDHRMRRNYLKGVSGDKINTILAASAYNMMKPIYNNKIITFLIIFLYGFDQTIKYLINALIKWMRWVQQEIFDFIFWWFFQPYFLVPVRIASRIR
ncbi:MAG: hypothetical protein JW866_10930 [Ignavibacteriales bacterium]|nr:hypothetical protein [Ignavibacteriales bacterium]